MARQQIALAAFAQVGTGCDIENMLAQPADRTAELGRDFAVMAGAFGRGLAQRHAVTRPEAARATA